MLYSVADVCIRVFLDAIAETQLGLEWMHKGVLLFCMPKILEVWKLEVPGLITQMSVFILRLVPLGYRMAASAPEIIALGDSIQRLEDEEKA